MIQLALAKRISASADIVWRFVSGAGLRDMALGGFVESIVGEGPEGPGRIFTTTMRNGVRVRERIERIDEVEREFTYRVIDSGPLTYAFHRAVMRVQPCGDDECLYSCRCDLVIETGLEEETKRSWMRTNLEKAEMIAAFFAPTKGNEPARDAAAG